MTAIALARTGQRRGLRAFLICNTPRRGWQAVSVEH